MAPCSSILARIESATRSAFIRILTSHDGLRSGSYACQEGVDFELQWLALYDGERIKPNLPVRKNGERVRILPLIIEDMYWCG